MAPAPVEHARQQPVGQLHGREDVQPEDLLVLGPRHLVEFALGVTTGVVDEHVHVVEIALCGIDQQIKIARKSEVRRHGQGGRAGCPELPRHRLQLGARPAGQDQVVTGARQRPRDVRADASRCPGDQGRASCAGHFLTSSCLPTLHTSPLPR